MSVPDLKLAIDEFMRARHENAGPFIWTESVARIIDKVRRARIKMEQIKQGSTLPRAIR